MMLTKDFHFELPPHLIAQHPLPLRSQSKLLVYERASQQTQHTHFTALSEFLKPGDLLVFNDSKVLPARLFAKKTTGGQVEILVERIVSETICLAHLRANKSLKIGTTVLLSNDVTVTIVGRENALFECCFSSKIVDVLHAIGHMPLPPYIERSDDMADRGRYQTVYAKHDGSVAAPTAGLHFDEAMFASLQKVGVQCGFVTLHVGAGTFQPVRTEKIIDHQIHRESMQVDEALCQLVIETKAHGGRVIAVGTTALRALESAASCGKLQPFSGETSIFIYPGYQFQVVDGLLTNFHLPESTLLMLVSALIGYDETMQLYQAAIAREYRFFSYGDASLLL